MNVNKNQLADIFGCDVRTISTWQSQGLPRLSGGGKGTEVVFDVSAAIAWFAEREAEIENEKLRKEVNDLRAAAESELQPGTIDYERYRLTKAQADAQELKNQVAEHMVIDTAFCIFALSRLAGELSSILDSIPLHMQRRFPELPERQLAFLKGLVAKTSNKCVEAAEKMQDFADEYYRDTAE